MSILDSLENKIAGLVEGTFSRVFRSEVRPVEIARKLTREMEDHRSHSLAHTFVPNQYRVFLSPKDRSRFEGYEDALADELGAYLLEHARREGFAMLSSPHISFATDPRLSLGEFGIRTASVAPEERAGPDGLGDGVGNPDSGSTMVHSTAARVAEPLAEVSAVRTRRAYLRHGGRRLVVASTGLSVGRSRACDIVVDDPNVSRRHAEVRPRGGSWVLSDLHSTNGTLLNRRPITDATVLSPGDEIEIGDALILFELE